MQTNWKASTKGIPDEGWQHLENRFTEMRERFGADVFKGTKTVRQLVKQAEIDVIGMTAGPKVHVHALDAAFHEGGLLYVSNGKDATIPAVRRKMLRTHLVLEAFAGFAQRHIWFLSPKVTPKPAAGLEEMFTGLQRAYSRVSWHLCIGQSFHDQVLQPTLEEAQGVSDTSELFLRAQRLLRVGSRT